MAHACGEALGWEQEMLNDRRTWDIATRCEKALGLEQKTIKCAWRRSCVLLQFILSCSDPSAFPYLSAMTHIFWSFLLSPALTSVLPYMHESSHMCSDILLSPALTPVLLLIYQHCSMYSDHSTISCSDCISSPHARAMSCVLQSFYSLLLRP